MGGAGFAKGELDAVVRGVDEGVEQAAAQALAADAGVDDEAADLGDLVVVVAKIQDGRAGGDDAPVVILDDQPEDVVRVDAALDPLRVVELGDGVVVAVIEDEELDDLLDIGFGDGAYVHSGDFIAYL